MALIIQHPAIAKQGQGKNSLPIADSSYLMHIEHDPESLQMKVTMKTGAEYVYSYVPSNVMEEFIKAPSKGKYYAEMVKGKFESTTIITKNTGKKVS